MLAQNVMHFARLLRRAGMAVGVPESLAGMQALTMVNLAAKGEVKAALRAVMVHRFEDLFLFDQAFELFWRVPEGNAAAPGEEDAAPEAAPPPGTRRLAEAMAEQNRNTPPGQEQEFKLDAAETFNARELLQAMDFEAMGAAEIARAKAEIKSLRLPLDHHRTRRWRADDRGPRIDLAATIRATLATGGEITRIARQRRITRPPPLVVLCDISGSMARYAQILLHFLHSVANDRDRVSVFLFGTRLSNITRQLKHRDAELAFAMVSALVPDWSGGTRIGEALGAFNQLWARRVLGQGAVVLLVTDGLDRDGAQGVAENMARLHRSCRRLIWLNPLLRWDGFSPRTQGARAMLPYVDEFRPVHNLSSLRSLIASLSAPPGARGGVAAQWRERT